MRSSVSAILSDPAPDNTMSFPDYSQSSSDHATLLVLCQHIGHQLDTSQYHSILDMISQVTEVKVADKGGSVRCVRVRYADRYPVENNEWGEFQAHRRVLGVITVGACNNNQSELAELCKLHEACRGKYHRTVFESRCIIVDKKSSKEIENSESSINGDDPVVDDNDENNENEKPPDWFTAHSHKSRLLQYQGTSYHAALNADIQDFISSLFWLLEKQRVEATRDTGDRTPLLCAPFERKDFVGLDMESRNNRKRVVGRLKKHLGDLSLQAGLLAEAWNYYQVAADVLKPANDWLWLGASLEGLCAVSVCLQDQQSRGVSVGSRGLSDHDMVEKYREAVIHYGKYKHAGIIETEASIKAVLVLIDQGNYLLAAEFLQNIVFINLQMNDAEKIARFLALSDLYQQIGFSRKSAFYKRVAAMRCVAPQNPSHDWSACYQLMLSAVPGYGINLSSVSPPEHGWPALQVQLLQELVGTSRRMGAHSASTRHMIYLVQHMFHHLSDTDRREFSKQLTDLSTRAGSSPEPLSLESLGLTLPPIPLTCLPHVTKFSPQSLPPHLLPHQRQSAQTTQVSSGPFLFTPIQSFGGGSARSSGRVKQQQMTWVAGEVGEVLVQADNPLLRELDIVQMSLMTRGLSVETSSSHVKLPPQSGHCQLSLGVTPLEAGTLTILGYSHTVLGVHSDCLLAEMSLEQDSVSQTVTVIPPLPLVTTLLEQRLGDTWVTVETSPVHLYSGETLQFRLTITNVGKLELTELSVEASMGDLSPGSPAPLVSVRSEDIVKSLPLAPGDSMTVTLCMTGQVDNMIAGVKHEDDNLSSTSDSRWSFSLPSSSFRSSLTPAPTGHNSLVSWSSVGSGGSSVTAVAGTTPLTSLQTVNVRTEYCSGEESRHCRRTVTTVNIVQIPSLIVTRWDVLPGDTQHNCFLVLDLVNRTHMEMELKYTERKTLLIEPGDMCRVPVPVTKCSFSDSLEWEDSGQGVVEYLGNCVHLEWNIVTQDPVSGEEITRLGTANLDNITWTDQMLDLIRRPPLVSSLSINGEEVVEGGEAEYRVGEVVSVLVRLSNQLLEPVVKCQLSVRLLQDSGGLRSAGAGAGAAGSPGLGEVGELVPGAELSHTTRLLALTPGAFKLVVTAQVTFRDKPHSWRLAPVNINIKI